MRRFSAVSLGVQLVSCACMALAAEAAHAAAQAPRDDASTAHRFVHNGVVVEFSAKPAGSAQQIMEGALADVRFRIVDEATGQPVKGNTPGAWMDMAQVVQGQAGSEQKSCKDKIALYLKGLVGIRPMLDLNSYFLVLLNKEASISVIDPLISLAGVTSTFARTPIKQPGEDWAQDDSAQRLYITMPKADEVAVIETGNFTVASYVQAGKAPTRIALQPDRRYLWVGNDAADSAHSGVTVVDTANLKQVGFIATGAGHHEIAFPADSRHAFVTNRTEGTVTVIDVASRLKLETIETGSTPLSLAYSALSRMVYVSDGKDGTVSVIDGEKLGVVKRIVAKPGLGPLRVTPDGRFALTVNPSENLVHVIDTASNELVQEVRITAQPYQIVFSETFAFVRSLGSERVSMISLASLGKGKTASVQSFAAGAVAPKAAGDLVIADSMAMAAGEGTVFVVNPAENSAYYYREGMNATSSGYKAYGSSARAVTVSDRSLREVEPGVYAGRVKIPVAGQYDVAFMLESPQVLHCFPMEARKNPLLEQSQNLAAVEFENWPRAAKAGETLTLRFKLVNPVTGQARAGVKDAQIMYFLAPGSRRTQTPVKEIGGGVYEVDVKLSLPGAYYIYPAVPSMNLGFGELPFFTLRAEPSGTPERAAGAPGSTGA